MRARNLGARGDPLCRPAEMENLNKNDDEEIQSGELQGVPYWLQEFNEGLFGGIVW